MDQDQNTSATSGAEIRWAKETIRWCRHLSLLLASCGQAMANTARARDAGRGAQKEVRPLASTLPLRENGRRDLFLQTITRCPSRDDEDNTMEGVTFAGQCRRGTPTLLPLFVAARLLHVFRVELSRSRRPESVLLAGRRDGLACTALLVSCVLVLFAARLRANQLSYGVLLGCKYGKHKTYQTRRKSQGCGDGHPTPPPRARILCCMASGLRFTISPVVDLLLCTHTPRRSFPFKCISAYTIGRHRHCTTTVLLPSALLLFCSEQRAGVHRWAASTLRNCCACSPPCSYFIVILFLDPSKTTVDSFGCIG